MTMLPPPDRYDFEREIKSHLPNDGDISGIARLLGKDRGLVSKQFNPNDSDRINPIYLGMWYLWAIDCLRSGPGDAIAMMACREREKWLGDIEVPILHPAHLTAEIGVQFSQFLEAELSGKDDDDQLQELTDIEEALRQKKDEILSRFRRNQARAAITERFSINAATNGGRNR
jgi:hypothetical protein